MKKIGFVVIAIVLSVGLIWSIYFIKQRGELTRKNQAIATYNKQQASQKTTEVAVNPTIKKPSDDTSSNQKSADSTNELPVTGPKNIISEMLGLGLLIGAMTSYVLSRRSLTRYL